VGTVPTELTAGRFVERLTAYRSPDQLRKYERAFRVAEGGDQFIGVRMGQVFALAKEFIELPPAELERLLDSPIHEVRVGA
jgi:DNA alkylation repair enzyme